LGEELVEPGVARRALVRQEGLVLGLELLLGDAGVAVVALDPLQRRREVVLAENLA
jgi:hypothetical protein